MHAEASLFVYTVPGGATTTSSIRIIIYGVIPMVPSTAECHNKSHVLPIASSPGPLNLRFHSE